jgi:iron complex outermembrane receptor protein
VESEVVPNLPGVYTNAGQPLAALKSRQAEIGLKHGGTSVDASAALFDIDRPATADRCDAGSGLCTRVTDGSARHRGAELLLSWRAAPAWQLHGSAMWLDAERRGAVEDAALNGLRPTNVAARTGRLQAVHQPAGVPGLSLLASLVYEGNRMVLPDNSVRIPGWTRLDLGARYLQTVGSTSLTWRLGLDNATDKRAWKEAPYQYGHAYLFPMAPRTWRVGLQADI